MGQIAANQSSLKQMTTAFRHEMSFGTPVWRVRISCTRAISKVSNASLADELPHIVIQNHWNLLVIQQDKVTSTLAVCSHSQWNLPSMFQFSVEGGRTSWIAFSRHRTVLQRPCGSHWPWSCRLPVSQHNAALRMEIGNHMISYCHRTNCRGRTVGGKNCVWKIHSLHIEGHLAIPISHLL
jgi:hypothetical protein